MGTVTISLEEYKHLDQIRTEYSKVLGGATVIFKNQLLIGSKTIISFIGTPDEGIEKLKELSINLDKREQDLKNQRSTFLVDMGEVRRLNSDLHRQIIRLNNIKQHTANLLGLGVNTEGLTDQDFLQVIGDHRKPKSFFKRLFSK